MTNENLEYSSFLEMINYGDLSNKLKSINMILKDEESKEFELIMTINSIRQLIQYINENYKKDNINMNDKLDMISFIILIHQDLTRIIYDETMHLPEVFYEKAKDIIEQLVIFYPAYIFSKQISNQQTEEVD